MKTLASITILSLVLSTPVLATCRLPNGQINDGTNGAAEMLSECGPNGQDLVEISAPVAKAEVILAAPAAPADEVGKISSLKTNEAVEKP